MKGARLLILVPVLLALISLPTSAAPLHSAALRDLEAGPCGPGAAYDPACDVNHDGNIDIYDIQLTASHWGQTGTYSIYPAMVPRTGQTTCYDENGTVIPCAGTGQDGDWQKGVAWPNPRFTDHRNGTVIDNLTGLIWLKNANCFGQRLWEQALSDANTLNSGECGLTDGSVEGDWRMPNVREMHSLIAYGPYQPALPSGHPFTGVQFDDYYFTSTTAYADYAWIVWGVSMSYGAVGGVVKSNFYYVWPVRGGQ